MASHHRALLAGLALACAAGFAARGHGQVYEPDPDAVEAFEQIIERSRRRAVTTKCTLELQLIEGETKSEPRRREAVFTHVPGGNGRIVIDEFTCSLNDGMLYAVHAGTDHSYYREEYEGSPYYYIFGNFQDMPFPHMAILWGEPLTTDVWMQMHPDTPWLVPTAVGPAPPEEGGAAGRRRLELASANGRLVLDYDPDSLLVEHMEHEVTGGHAVQPGVRKLTKYTLEHTVHEDPPDVTFDVGSRQRVDMMASLVPPPAADPAAGPRGPAAPDLAGRPAPPFVLATADGGAVDLEELRGHVVVIDFWATWCGPCVNALPRLHEVADWARREELPVTVLTINVWERVDSPEERLKAVKAFWSAKGFTLPVALDYSGETARAYGVAGIPATFVIRSDGVVHAQHTGAGPGYAEDLRHEIRDALDALELDPEVAPDP